MSQLTPAGVSATQQLRTHWILALSALLALLATAALVLVLAIDRGSSQTSTATAIGNSTAEQSYWESSEPRTSYQPAPADSISQSTRGARP
jgi:hypothetical protein